MLSMIKLAAVRFGRLKKDEDGLALTEYLILLGLLTAAVIGAVVVFGTELGEAWQEWATWLETEDLGGPSDAGGTDDDTDG